MVTGITSYKARVEHSGLKHFRLYIALEDVPPPGDDRGDWDKLGREYAMVGQGPGPGHIYRRFLEGVAWCS